MRKRGTFKIPLWLATTPKSGECIVNEYWTTVVENGIRHLIFYYGGKFDGKLIITPQCNPNEFTAKRISDKLYDKCRVIQIPVVFIAHANQAIKDDVELDYF